MGNISLNFNREEFECRCYQCGFDTVDSELLEILQWLRNRLDAPITINSAHRCPEHNRAVGGSERSQHLLGRAADIVVAGFTPREVFNELDTSFGKKVSLGLYDSFVHVDSRTNGGARWEG